MQFVWAETKASSNLRKHGVSFLEAGTIFDDPLAITYDDPDHSDDEDRFITLGFSKQNRLLIVSHTARAGLTRITSARPTTRQERSHCEDPE